MNQSKNFSPIHSLSGKKLSVLLFLACISSGILLISNLSAVKIWNLFGIPVDAGVLIFPLSYIISDIIIEFFGSKVSKTIVYSAFFLNVLAAFVFWLAILLPSFPGWELQPDFTNILGFTPRIIFGSLLAFLTSSLLNISFFEFLRKKTKGKNFIIRALGSSAVARIIDSLIFETIAFIGVLPFSDFIKQIFFAYFLGLFFEIILSPIELLIVNFLKKHQFFSNS